MKYDDIIDLPAFHAEGRPRMSNRERAAQFMPFKSLNPYHDLVGKKEDEILDVKWEVIEYEDDEHML
ncbi:hypothetical protein IKE13_00650 [Candidatus Saccharibacteria bacterium]|nr:hypothetical protein [Candidatus Saccharibacteria bacterium]